MSQRADPEEAAYAELQRGADRLCFLIVSTDYPAIDVAIEIAKLRQFAEEHFPGKAELFDRIYGSRFRRLWQQFRPASGEALPQW